MKIIGITGGVGSGKSAVLSYMADTCNATTCQADAVARRLQSPGEECYLKMVEYFGTQIVGANGALDRKTLGQIVFSDAQKRKVLNQIVHPKVKEAIKAEIEVEREKGTGLFVIEAALLLEDNYDEICDELWYIYTDEKKRRTRLKQSRAYDDVKIDEIIRSQSSDTVFREKCDKVIDNSGDFLDTCRQVSEQIKLYR